MIEQIRKGIAAGARVIAREDVDEQNTHGGDCRPDPGWREAARPYHIVPESRVVVTEIEPERLARLRRLMSNDVSLYHTWRQLNDRGDQPAPQVTLDALIYELRTDGIAALRNPSCRRRLADLSNGQLCELIAALIRARAKYPAISDDLLLALDELRQ
jgi:hypothetical protein